MRAWSVALLLAAGPAAAVPDAARYRALVDGLENERRSLASAWQVAADRTPVLRRARSRLERAIVDELVPAWIGTPWAFYGMTETPRTGEIACGYLVTTVLRDAGLRVERALLAQQASEHIIQTLVPETNTVRFRHRTAADVLAHVRAAPSSLHLVGLDFHVGLLVRSGDDVRFCHASYLPPVAVVCEPAERSAAFVSRYYVTGELLTDALVQGWLETRAYPTRTARRGR